MAALDACSTESDFADPGGRNCLPQPMQESFTVPTSHSFWSTMNEVPQDGQTAFWISI